MNQETILIHYLTCALWSSCGDEETFLDSKYTIDDIHDSALKQSAADIAAFVERAGPALDGLDDAQIGHDFWLTRNHHGAGFWDRGLGIVGQKLTQVAHSFGEATLYMGDDDSIYVA